MHAIFFMLKRGFLSAVNDSRYVFNAFELTPARFDLLYIVSRTGRAIQSDVRKELGVSGPVVCRMTISLLEKGWITRERYKFDKRQLLLELTPLGREAFDHAKRFLRTNRMGDRIVARMVKRGLPPFRELNIDWKDAFDEPTPLRPERIEAYDEMATLRDALDVVRRQCRDRAWLNYPWARDD